MMTWFHLLLFSIFLASSLWCGGVPGGCVGLAWVANIAVLSANVPNVVSLVVSRSDVYSM